MLRYFLIIVVILLIIFLLCKTDSNDYGRVVVRGDIVETPQYMIRDWLIKIRKNISNMSDLDKDEASLDELFAARNELRAYLRRIGSAESFEEYTSSIHYSTKFNTVMEDDTYTAKTKPELYHEITWYIDKILMMGVKNSIVISLDTIKKICKKAPVFEVPSYEFPDVHVSPHIELRDIPEKTYNTMRIRAPANRDLSNYLSTDLGVNPGASGTNVEFGYDIERNRNSKEAVAGWKCKKLISDMTLIKPDLLDENENTTIAKLKYADWMLPLNMGRLDRTASRGKQSILENDIWDKIEQQYYMQ